MPVSALHAAPMGQEWPLSGARDLQRSGGRPVAASMGSGMAAERSKGSARVRRSPVAASAHRGRLDGVKVLPLAMVQDCPLSGQRG